MVRAMEVQEVILRAIAKKITWWQAAEIISTREWHTTLARALRGVRFSRLFDRPVPQARTSSFAKNSMLLWVTRIA
jgi:hypothetical protein